MSIVDEAVVWGKRSVDPWNRMTCCPEPVLIVIEFCQVQGPRPLFSYPANGGGPHLDLDSVAVWLMSSEAVHGSSMIVYSQQMAVFACVHHSTLFDLFARAFQRPISVALLTPSKPTTAIFKEFIEISRRMLSPLLICNRILFKSHLIQLTDLAKAIEQNAPEKKDLFASMSKSSINKIQSVSAQARRMLQRFEYGSLQSSVNSTTKCSGHERGSNDSEFLKQFGDHSPLLQEVQFLTPCIYNKFIEALPEAYKKFLNTAKVHKTGALFCAETPVLKLKDRDNHYLEDNSDHSSVYFLDKNDYQRNLITIIESLDKILFALLSGENLVLCSLDERKSLGKDLLKKLNLLRVCMQRQNAYWVGEHEMIKKDCQLYGRTITRKTSLTALTNNELSMYDVDGRWLRCKNYRGKALNFLSLKRSDSFPTDYALIQYIVARLTEFCLVVYLARWKDVDKLRRHLQLEEDDIKILINLLAEFDVLKFGAMKEKTKKEGTCEMTVFKV